MAVPNVTEADYIDQVLLPEIHNHPEYKLAAKAAWDAGVPFATAFQNFAALYNTWGTFYKYTSTGAAPAPTGGTTNGSTGGTTGTEPEPPPTSPSFIAEQLVKYGVLTASEVGQYDGEGLLALYADAQKIGLIPKTTATGTGSGTGSVPGPNELANAAGQNILNNFNPATDLIPLPDGRSLIRGTSTIVDTRVGGGLSPVSGIPNLFYDPISKQFIDRSGNVLDANRLLETIRSNKANEALASGQLILNQQQLQETIRSNQMGEAIQGQQVTNAAVSNIAQLGANPANWVEREYTIRGLNAPSPTGSNRFDVSGALAKLYGASPTGAPTGTGAGVGANGTPLANQTLASKGYPTLAQTLADPRSNPNWMVNTPVVDPATGTDPRLGATGTTRTPAEAQSLAGLMAQEWNATHPAENTLPEAQLGAAGLPSTGPIPGVNHWDPASGWVFTPTDQTAYDAWMNPGNNASYDDVAASLQGVVDQGTVGDVQTAGGYYWDPTGTGGIQSTPSDSDASTPDPIATPTEPAVGATFDAGFDAAGGYTDEFGNYSPPMAHGGMTTDETFLTGDPQAGQPVGNPEVISNPTGAPIGVTPLADMMGGQQPQQQGGGLAKLLAGILVEISNQWGPNGGMAEYAYGTANRPPVAPSLPSQATRPMPTQSRAGMSNRMPAPRPMPLQSLNRNGMRAYAYGTDMPIIQGDPTVPPTYEAPPLGDPSTQWITSDSLISPTGVTGGSAGAQTTTGSLPPPTTVTGGTPGPITTTDNLISPTGVTGGSPGAVTNTTPLPAPTGGNVFGNQLYNDYGFAPQSDANLQMLPSLRALYTGDLGWYNAPREQFVGGPFGTILPGSGMINVANYNQVAKDPTSLGLLQSLYRGASRDLTSEVARARRFAPVGRGLQSLSTVRT